MSETCKSLVSTGLHGFTSTKEDSLGPYQPTTVDQHSNIGKFIERCCTIVIDCATAAPRACIHAVILDAGIGHPT